MRLTNKQFSDLVSEVVLEIDGDSDFNEIVGLVVDMGHDLTTARHVADELGRRQARVEGQIG